MAATLTHMTVAHRLNSKAGGAYLLGSFAPDYVKDRIEKDRIHLRLRTPEGMPLNSEEAQVWRWEKLAELANVTNPNDEFAEGWLLHMFTDLIWDKDIIAPYFAGIEKTPGFFQHYRDEISRSSFYIFHRDELAKELLRMAMDAPTDYKGSPDYPTPKRLEEFRTHVNEIHIPYIGAAPQISVAFPPQQVDDFIEKAVELYPGWRKSCPFKG